MKRTRFDYYTPDNIENACKLFLELGDGAYIMAGGTDLLVKIHRGVLKAKAIIDIKKIKGIDGISYEKGKGLTIGATARLTDVGNHPDIKAIYPAISKAALCTANTQIRNMGTVTGNLCNAAPSADNAPALITMGAVLNLKGIEGERVVPLGDFFKGPGMTVIKKGELVTSIFVPDPPKGAGTSYQYLSARGKVDIASVCVGATVIMTGDVCREAKIILGAVAPVPMRAKEAEKVVIGHRLSTELLERLGLTASRESRPITDMRSTAEYRKILVAVLSARAVEEAAKNASKK
jgi:CO/xanthine dehydrogenase FAD-binding subunit